MPGRPTISSLFAITIVLVLIIASLAMIISPSEEELPQGDLPTFLSEGQMRSYLAERQMGQGYYNNSSLTDEASGGNYHSKTNVQVSGVDELDTVKTDGEFIYVSSYGGVSVVKAYPTNVMSNVTILELDQIIGKHDTAGSVLGLFLHDDVLVVLASEYGQWSSPYLEADIYAFSGEMLITCALVDVTDPYHPAIMARYSISGNFAGSRMIEDTLYLLGEESIWWMGGISMPITGINGDMKEVAATSIRFDPEAEDANAFLNIMALDLNTGQHNFTSIITGYSAVMYASPDNIYLAYVSYGGRSDDVTMFWDKPITTLFRLKLDGLEVTPQATGQVEGLPLNQFSMDEQDGVLRMAISTSWSNGESQVYTFDQDLKVIGSLVGLAPGESIQSVRFMGPTLYLVTFLVTDPLFVIDLSDPFHPRVLGELVVPGFSAYLHPCGNGMLVGIGFDNWTMKVSLFDVNDPTSPLEVDTILAPTNSWSEAMWDHRAVLFEERYDLIFVPVTTWNEFDYGVTQQVLVIQVGPTGLVLMADLTVGNDYGSVRCVVIEDVLYTVTASNVTAWGLVSYDELGTVNIGSFDFPGPGVVDGTGGIEVRA